MTYQRRTKKLPSLRCDNPNEFDTDFGDPEMPDHLTVENTAKMGRDVTVFLDGAEASDVIEAHISEGWIEVIVKDTYGNVLIDGDEICRARVHGVVTAEWV